MNSLSVCFQRMGRIQLLLVSLLKDNNLQPVPSIDSQIALLKLIKDFPLIMPTDDKFRNYVLVRWYARQILGKQPTIPTKKTEFSRISPFLRPFFASSHFCLPKCFVNCHVSTIRLALYPESLMLQTPIINLFTSTIASNFEQEKEVSCDTL